MKRRNSRSEATSKTKKARFVEHKPTIHVVPNDASDGEVDFDIDYMDDANRRKSKRKLKNGGASSSSESEGEEEEKKDEDVDMFGEGDVKEGGKGKGKKMDDAFVDKGFDLEKGGADKEFLELKDIKGQEFDDRGKRKNAYGSDDEEAGSDGEASEEEYLSEDDHANDDDAPRTKRPKTGMGFSLTGFNMAEEMREGRFSSDGSYIRNAKDQGEKHDAWLQGVNSKKKIKEAREAKKKRDEREKAKEDEETLDKDDCFKGVLEIVGPRETVTQALSRLGKLYKKAPKTSKKASDMAVDDPTYITAGEQLERLTTFTSTLLSSHNEITIYEMTGLTILQTLKEEGAVRRDWLPTNSTYHNGAGSPEQNPSVASGSLISRPTGTGSVATEVKDVYYRFLKDHNKTIQGPFSRAEMINWAGMGYFGVQGDNVEISRDGGTTWTGWNL